MNSIEAENAALREENVNLAKFNTRLNETMGRVVEQRDTFSAENGMLRDRVDGLEAACDELRREVTALRASSASEMRGMVIKHGAMG